jgi:hypothetical protein
MPWYELPNGLVMTDKFGPCCQCGGPTNTLDVDFQVKVHQGTCFWDLLNEWWEAEERAQHQEIMASWIV